MMENAKKAIAIHGAMRNHSGGLQSILAEQRKAETRAIEDQTRAVQDLARTNNEQKAIETLQFDQMVARTFANIAVDLIADGVSGRMTAIRSGRYTHVAVPDPSRGPRTVAVARFDEAERFRPRYDGRNGDSVMKTRPGSVARIDRSFAETRDQIAGLLVEFVGFMTNGCSRKFKVSKCPLNSVKRLLRETGAKAGACDSAFGKTVPSGAMIAGQQADDSKEAQDGYGVAIFREHDLGPLQRGRT